ncbi:Hypothetical predicted protein, partial [Marmota monax]
MAYFGVSASQAVAVVWDKSSPVEALKDLVDKLQVLTGDEGQVFVENMSQLLPSAHKKSSFDIILSGVVPGSVTLHSAEITGKKPNFEVGSSSQLKLSITKKSPLVKPAVDPATAKLWTLSANDMEDESMDLIDSDEL